MNWKTYFPILEWLPNYQKKYLYGDLIAGMTVGIVLIPQGIAYALIAGLPPIFGLYAAFVPQIVYAIFGSSRQVSPGPAAMDSLIVAAGIMTLAITNQTDYINAVLLLTLMVGVMQFLLGILRMGFVVNFLSRPVISGFTSAAGLLIGLNQFKNLTGAIFKGSNELHHLIIEFIKDFNTIDVTTLSFGIGAIVVLILIKEFKLKIPGAFTIVVLGILIRYFFKDSLNSMAIIGTVPSGFPSLHLPTLEWTQIKQIIPISFTLAVIGFLEAISIGKSLEAKQTEYKIKPNQELIALGMGNMIGSFFMSFVSSVSFSRSAVSHQSGAKTPLAVLVSASIILLTLLFLTPVFYYLPKAILAAIIIVSAFGLIDYKNALRLYKNYKIDFFMMMITFIITLFIGIKEGILTGVLLSLLIAVYKTSKPHVAILGRVPKTKSYRNIERFQDLDVDPELLIIRFDARIYFANADYFRDKLDEEVARKRETIKGIVIDAQSINGIDSTGISILEEQINKFNSQEITIYFTDVKGPLRDAFAKGGIFDLVGLNHFFLSIEDAVNYHHNSGNPKKSFKKYIRQSNISKT